jgi:hypothetical protein
MESLVSEAQNLIRASMAQNSWKAYENALNNFFEFRRNLNLGSHWPLLTADIVAFIAYLSLGGWAPSYISVHMSAIAFVHKINGWPDPTDSFIVKKMKEGNKRLKGSKDKRYPITFPILKRLIGILHLICRSSYEVTLICLRLLFLYLFSVCSE